MAISIRPLRDGFAGEVAGIDITRPITRDEVLAIEAGMDAYAVLMWDNRTTMHRARRFDRTEVRDVRRTTLAGHAPTVEQEPTA